MYSMYCLYSSTSTSYRHSAGLYVCISEVNGLAPVLCSNTARVSASRVMHAEGQRTSVQVCLCTLSVCMWSTKDKKKSC